MAKKIILFLSLLSEDESKRKTKDYACTAGVLGMDEAHKITGTQTNEAPVKAMLLAHPDVRSIICIVTPQAKESTLDFFKTHILEFAREKQIKLPDDIFKIIDFQNDEVFTEGPLQRVLNEIQPGGMGKNSMGDEILLETTGGWRNTMMYLLLLSRVLTYNHNQTIGATYADFNNQQITDVSDLLRMFDLVGGMQEMSSFGNVRTLRKYFGAEPQDERIGELLDALEALNEAITLCRTSKVSGCLERFIHAVNEVKSCDNPLVRQLTPAFDSIFRERKFKIRSLIRWCLERDMYQQAVTLYIECIPTEIFKNIVQKKQENHLFNPKYDDKTRFSDADEFFCYLLNASRYTSASKGSSDQYAMQVYTIENLETCFPSAPFELKPGYKIHKLQNIARDYLYIKLLRNMINHAQTTGTESTEQAVEYLKGCGYCSPDAVDLKTLRTVMENALNNLKV